MLFYVFYGIIFFIIYNSKMGSMPKILLIVSCSVVLFIYIWLIVLSVGIAIQVNNIYREAYQRHLEEVDGVELNGPPTNFDEVPTLICQNYHNLSEIEWCIWMQNFKAGDIIKVLPDCFHYFHFLCIQEWFRRKKVCPLDKKPITKDAIEATKNLSEADLISKITVLS